MLKRLWSGEEGATAIEYGLIAALIAVPMVAFLPDIGTRLTSAFETIKEALPEPTTTTTTTDGNG